MSEKKETLVLLDAHAILHRAFHALPSFSSPQGEPTGALYGLSSFLLKVLRELSPKYIAAAYDLKEPTFRHAAYEKYKAQRPDTASVLSSQIERSYEILKAFNIPIFEHPKFEADDIIGTIAEKTKKEKNLEVIIASGDLDTLQLVDKTRVRVFTLRKGIQDTIFYDEKRVVERFGFPPELLPDFKGLKGDPSDNIPGVPGIGDKSASELIQKFGSLEKILKAAKQKEAMEKAGVKARISNLLKEHEEEALFSKTLALIRRDVPIDFSLAFLDWKARYKKEKAEILFKELGFLSLLSRLPEDSSVAVAAGEKKVETEKLSLLRNEKEIWWYFSEKENKIYAASRAGKIFKMDSEISAHSLPREFLTEKVKNYFFDAKKFFHLFSGLGPSFQLEDDFRILAWLLRPQFQDPELAGCLNVFLPRDFSGKDGLQAAELFPKLGDVLLKELSEKNLEKVYREIEMPLIPVLFEMEKRGVLLDVKFLKKLSGEYEKKLSELEKKIWEHSGMEFNINSPKQLSEVLFEKLKLTAKGLKKTSLGAKSTRESELLKLKDLHPVIRELLSYRELSKLKNTYLDAFPKLTDREGRVHTNFDQTGTVTGRLSSSEPNLQNIPIRSELGREIRKAFVAPPGFKLVAFDYSQLELRIAAVLSGDEKMLRAFKEGKDIHTATASEIFNISPEKVTEEMRRDAKVINFGILYGMGVNALSQAMEVPREKAQIFWEEYFKDFEGVRKFIEATEKKARKQGYVETLFGRRRYLPEIYSSAEYIRKEAERMAVNAPIQGTGADIVKLGMIRASEFIKEKSWDRDAYLVSQIHDELLFEVKDELVSVFVDPVKKILEEIYQGDITLTVETKIGDNWGEMRKYNEHKNEF